MNSYTFKVTEHGLAGPKDREIIIKARTEKSAVYQLVMKQGNRCWEWKIIKTEKIGR